MSDAEPILRIIMPVLDRKMWGSRCELTFSSHTLILLSGGVALCSDPVSAWLQSIILSARPKVG
ncbi:hypothetical protein [Paenibacillus hexagrammi]|uniref:Uncharacterized protein n=1 Tax=Paenibacillus hexagrammi TaxID=2908839 RepID=A0ABY3SF55_9BACL|nr:hypothetical protein [Paenibacillus sp. YPD9-1]UJF32628.1 hypothetical protein L0M14_23830 [Paenibacillus sp. YPD9-1]